MGGKAKPTKHTAKELAGKAAAALTNKGGGKDGRADRAGGGAGHSKMECYVCKMVCPSIKSMEEHFNSKHSKMGSFDPAKVVNKHDGLVGSTVKGVAVRGGFAAKQHHN